MAIPGEVAALQVIYLPDQGIPRWPPFHCDVNRLSEHSPTMNRMPEKMSFTHAELESIAGSTGPVMSTSIRSHAAEENVRPAAAPATLDPS
jgi:hypothetical protein